MEIEIRKIKLKTNTQSRVKIDQNVVDEYAEDLKEGAKFPPIILFKNEKNYYIGDGWHRLYSSKKIGKKTIQADVKPGSIRDAILYSISSNTAHGLRRTNEDKRKSVTMLLEDKEWQQWSDREISRQCCVGNKLVSNIRKELTVFKTQIINKKVKRGGKEYKINTANIGKNAKKVNLEHVNTMKIDNNSKPKVISEFKRFRILGWDIYIRRSRSEKNLIRHSEV